NSKRHWASGQASSTFSAISAVMKYWRASLGFTVSPFNLSPAHLGIDDDPSPEMAADMLDELRNGQAAGELHVPDSCRGRICGSITGGSTIAGAEVPA